MITDTSEVDVEWLSGSLALYHLAGACPEATDSMARTQATLLGVRPCPTCFGGVL